MLWDRCYYYLHFTGSESDKKTKFSNQAAEQGFKTKQTDSRALSSTQNLLKCQPHSFSFLPGTSGDDQAVLILLLGLQDEILLCNCGFQLWLSPVAPSSCICSETGTRSWAGAEQGAHPPCVGTFSLVTLAPLAAVLTLTLKTTKTPMSPLSTHSTPQLCLYHPGLRRLDLF